MYLQTVAEADATGALADIYKDQKARMGFVMATAFSMSPRPDLLPLYTDFMAKVRAGFSLGQREWRLITLVAAKQVPSTYCSYVYGQQLIADLGSKQAVIALQRDFRKAGLSEQDVAMLAYAEQIARDASKIGPADIEPLRRAGFSDRQICDIALRASLRCFISRFYDAVGAGPDAAYIDEDLEFRAALTVGKKP
ncbi:MAG: hypothetical protein ACK4FJ_10165 [Ferrovibrio sp.]|uniref:hypothetical protein n=1 Tax=Ferrovibrio sp. TaxID=1917215 RepID=UPI00391D25E9